MSRFNLYRITLAFLMMSVMPLCSPQVAYPDDMSQSATTDQSTSALASYAATPNIALTANIIDAVRADDLANARRATDALLADPNTAIDPNNARPVYLLGWEYHAKDLKSDADKVYNYVETAYPDTQCAKLAAARRLVIKVDIAAAGKDPNSVKEYFSQFQTIDPNIYANDEGSGLMYWMSGSCAKAGLYDQSNYILETMVQVYPNSTQTEEARLAWIVPNPTALTDLQICGVLANITSEEEPAIDVSRSALWYADIYAIEAQNRKGDARQVCNRIAQQLIEKYIINKFGADEITSLPYILYGQMCFKLGDWDKAIYAFTNSYLADSNFLGPALVSVALCHEKKKDGQAASVYQTIVDSCPNTAWAFQATIKLNELNK